jgi:hypothetical protein
LSADANGKGGKLSASSVPLASWNIAPSTRRMNRISSAASTATPGWLPGMCMCFSIDW